jgi:hypothetical protein
MPLPGPRVGCVYFKSSGPSKFGEVPVRSAHPATAVATGPLEPRISDTKQEEPLESASGSDACYSQCTDVDSLSVCYALTTRNCRSEERYQSTPATSSRAGTSPTR